MSMQEGNRTMALVGYDAISANIGVIPANAEYIFGYVTGSPYIVWSLADFNRFPNAHKEYIDQGNGSPWRIPTVIDIENGAHSPGEMPGLALKYPGVKAYCNLSTLPALHATGWRGQVWVAAPSQNADVIKTNVEKSYPGFTVFAVQSVWQGRYDASVIYSAPPVPVPPAVDTQHLNIDGWKVRKPSAEVIPCVIAWWGDGGINRRESNMPRALWDQIPWSG